MLVPWLSHWSTVERRMPLVLMRDPIYQQLNRALRELIGGSEFRPGARFLSERQVSERFAVSRATANKALSNLVVEGVLEFRKGVGTFVRQAGLDYDLRALVSFTEKALQAGKQPETQLLHYETHSSLQVDAAVTKQLRLTPADETYYVVRLRLADGLPVIFEHRQIVARFCPGLTAADLQGSLYSVWIDRYQLEIAGAEQTIRAVSIQGDAARLLQVVPGSAGFLVRSTGYLTGGEPLWWEETLYRGDTYEFHNRLGPLQSGGPAGAALVDIRNLVSERRSK